ncbi:B-box zinc finger protein, partial [Gemmatimonadota bacterium]
SRALTPVRFSISESRSFGPGNGRIVVKCTQHPDREAEGSCSTCSAPLCGTCLPAGGEGPATCNKCLALQAAGEVVEKSVEKTESIELERQNREEAKKRQARLQRMIPIALVLVIVIVNVFLYLGTPITETESLEAAEEPVAAMVIIDSALREYLRIEGESPDGLATLLDEYLPSGFIEESDLVMFRYSRPSLQTYELSLAVTPEIPGFNLVFTEGGPK